MMGMPPHRSPSLGNKIDGPVTEFIGTFYIMATSEVYEEYCNPPILLPDYQVNYTGPYG